jgi:TolB protein
MDADGRDVREVVTGGPTAASPQWSPDGRLIAFVSDRDRIKDLYVIPANGGGSERLTTGAHLTSDPPLWSPDGSLIDYQIADGENYDIGAVRLSDRAHWLLAASSAYDGSYSWAPDGKHIAFISGRDGFDALYSVDMNGQHPLRLTSTASLTPAWGSQR